MRTDNRQDGQEWECIGMVPNKASIKGIGALMALIPLFSISGSMSALGDETVPMDWPLLDSRYENHAWGDQYASCVIWYSGAVTEHHDPESRALGFRSASDTVIARLDGAKIKPVRELIRIAAAGRITDPESAANDAGVRSFNAWLPTDRAIPPAMGDFLLMQWGDEERINTSDAASELVQILIETFKDTNCPGAELGRPKGSILDPRRRHDASPGHSTASEAVSAPFGEYYVVALRNASDVATTANPGAGTQWLGQRVSFSAPQLSWLDGQSCDLWSVRETDAPVIMLADPNLSDLAIAPVDSETSSGDKRVNMSVELVCHDDSDRVVGRFVIIDGRVLVASEPPWTVNLILERPLTEEQIKQFQAQLKDMKFFDGEITSVLDEPTLSSIGFYADYRGSAFRFRRTAITENLLDGLGVLGTEAAPAFPVYEPKTGPDSLRDYRPQFADQIDGFPEVTYENLDHLLSRLNSLDLKASKMPGAWVAGNIALGAEPKEYVPSYSEIMAAALGDHIRAFVETADRDALSAQWPERHRRSFQYNRFEIRHVDVMGSGRFFYSSAPIPVKVTVP